MEFVHKTRGVIFFQTLMFKKKHSRQVGQKHFMKAVDVAIPHRVPDSAHFCAYDEAIPHRVPDSAHFCAYA